MTVGVGPEGCAGATLALPTPALQDGGRRSVGAPVLNAAVLAHGGEGRKRSDPHHWDALSPTLTDDGGRCSRDTPIEHCAPANAAGPGHWSSDPLQDGAGSGRTANDPLASIVGPGHTTGDPHSSTAGSPARVEHGEVSRATLVAPIGYADLSVLHASLGHYARLLGAIQKQRIAAGNLVGAMERDGMDEAWSAPAQAAADHLKQLEKNLEAHLTRLAKRHPLAPWIVAQKGVGLPSFARLLGITGPLDQFPTVSKLWAYLGLAVVDGHAVRRQKGVKATFSPQGQVLCYLMGEAIVKGGRGGEYRAVYDQIKARYEAERPDWTQARRHAAARRYATKRLLRHLWREWRRVIREQEAA